jgi:hypothetical protein
MNRPVPALIVGCAMLIAAVACKSDPTGPAYEPDLPTDWAASVSNPFFPLVAGSTLRYEGETDEGLEVIVVEVTGDTRMVNGVLATVVRDRVYLDGDLIEDTFDWYAQDAAGNVWYLGEDSREIEDGQVVSTEGSWEWGVDDALPGIIMWADPAAHIDEDYRQEYYEDEAEDWGRVVETGRTVTVPFGTFAGCVVTEEWNALEPGTLEQKSYCPQVGFVLEVKLEGGNERVELVDSSGS